MNQVNLENFVIDNKKILVQSYSVLISSTAYLAHRHFKTDKKVLNWNVTSEINK